MSLEEGKMYRKVLVPLDGSALAECALNHVKTLIKEGSAGQITLLTVVRVDNAWGREADINAIREKALFSSGKYLADKASRLAEEGMTVETAVVEGQSIAQAIIDYAGTGGMDLIAIATHGYTGMKGIMLGSVASGVTRQSHVPVLLIRPESCKS
jgi:nucleotide-binding universal stress UspA family protein